MPSFTAAMFGEGDVPTYWTEPENVASRNLSTSLGCRQYGQRITYV